MNREQAIDIIARHARARWAQDFGEDGDWEAYPEIGEYDWNDVAATIQQEHAFPTPAEFDEAYALLSASATRTDHQTVQDAP